MIETKSKKALKGDVALESLITGALRDLSPEELRELGDSGPGNVPSHVRSASDVLAPGRVRSNACGSAVPSGFETHESQLLPFNTAEQAPYRGRAPSFETNKRRLSGLLRNQILLGRRAGERLDVTEIIDLAQRVNLPIDEIAANHLLDELLSVGLLTSGYDRSLRVPVPVVDEDALACEFGLRLALEPFAVRRLIAKREKVDVSPLVRLNKDMALFAAGLYEALETANEDAIDRYCLQFVLSDLLWHEVLMEMSGCISAIPTIRTSFIKINLNITHLRSQKRMLDCIKEHQAIVRVIEQKLYDDIDKAFETHFVVAARTWVPVLENFLK